MQVITKLKLKMRTKHILTAMVLPALFAACTADDFETVNVAGDSQRPMLSGVTLTTVDGADTRYAVEEGAAGLKFNYENGDQIGAAIIDQLDYHQLYRRGSLHLCISLQQHEHPAQCCKL